MINTDRMIRQLRQALQDTAVTVARRSPHWSQDARTDIETKRQTVDLCGRVLANREQADDHPLALAILANLAKLYEADL